MKHKLPCELIQDLFPSYIDGLTSDVTNEIVEEHIAECEDCRNRLEAMKEPSVQFMNSQYKEEIDFLKKTRKKNQRILFGSIILSIVMIVGVLAAKIFFIGSHVYSEMVACDITVDGNRLSITGVIADKSLSISSVKYEEMDGVVTVSFKAVKKSPFYQGEFQSEYEACENITQVCLDERIVWAQGETISAITSAVYQTRHPYVGAMPENGRTAMALNITNDLGNFTNELQTTTEPYGWKLILENEISASQKEKKESDMRSYAYILLAVIDNLGEVSYEYRMDGEVHLLTVKAEEATVFAGQDIKECGSNVAMLQKLMEKIGLDT